MLLIPFVVSLSGRQCNQCVKSFLVNANPALSSLSQNPQKALSSGTLANCPTIYRIPDKNAQYRKVNLSEEMSKA